MRIPLIIALLLALPTTAFSAGPQADCKGTNPDRIIPACTQLITSSRSSADKAAAYDQRAWAHNAKGDHARALDDANQALQLHPALATAYGNRGWAHAGKGDYEAALTAYNEALRLDSKLWTVYNLRAWAHAAKSDTERAIADYGTALRLNPRFYTALNGRGATYAQMCDYDKAISDFTDALTLKPDLRSSYSYRAWAYMAKGAYDLAVADSNEAIRLTPKAFAYADRGWIYHLKTEYDRAIADYTKAIQLDPTYSLAFSNRAETFNMLAEHDRAVTDSDAAIKLDPMNKYAYDSRGRAYLAKRDYDAALADFNKSIAIDPTYLLALLGRAKALLAKNDQPGAAADFKAAVDLRVCRLYEKQAQNEAATRLSELKTIPPPPEPRPLIRPPVAEQRVALVIGNSAYQYTPKLANPKNDASDVAAALKKYGFRVIEGFDLDKRAFERKIIDFATALKAADVGLFFYSGHGLQVAGRNYLVPVDAKAEGLEALEFEMVRTEIIQRIMEDKASTNVIFLDACRDNPLARNLARSMGTRSLEVGKGLAAVESGVGTLISFSTQPGNVALDGSGRNSPFTGPLVKHLVNSTDDLYAILIDVRNDVIGETRGKQVPWEHSALRKRFYFNNKAQIAEPARLSEAAEAWDRVKDTTNIGLLEAFAVRFKESFFAEMARVRIEALKKQ